MDLTSLAPIPSDGGHLTKAEVTAIERYVRKILQALNLGNWRVYVSADLPPEGTRASIFPTDNRRIAALCLPAGWITDVPNDEKQLDIIHECLHLIHHDVDHGIRRFFDDSGDIGEYVKHVVQAEFKTNLERMVDSLSYALAELLPPWPDLD